MICSSGDQFPLANEYGGGRRRASAPTPSTRSIARALMRKWTTMEQHTYYAHAGPGTPMGRLLRQYWQPLALAEDVAPGGAIPVRLMNEDLTLYRGESGAPYLVAQRCAHRRTLLYTGWVEEECLRCMYHGWKYDGSGQCIEMPAED